MTAFFQKCRNPKAYPFMYLLEDEIDNDGMITSIERSSRWVLKECFSICNYLSNSFTCRYNDDLLFRRPRGEGQANLEALSRSMFRIRKIMTPFDETITEVETSLYFKSTTQ